jgi:hypothetical protein
MSRMPKLRSPSTRRSPRRPKAFVEVPARLEPAQVAALRREAKRRLGRVGRGSMDVSEVLREAVSVWMAIRPVQRAIIRAVAARQELTGSEVLRMALDTWLLSLRPDKG